IHVAIGTSLFIMAFTSFSGVINHILFGNLPLLAIIFGICLAAGAVIGSSIGARVAYKLVDEKIKKIYGIITVCLAIPLIWLRIFLPSDPIEVFINNWISFFANLFP
ncbi:MAG: TSUP family transporter, partial [Promethearchaeota archaeon]